MPTRRATAVVGTFGSVICKPTLVRIWFEELAFQDSIRPVNGGGVA